jgi:DNA polymerase III subunit delta'
MKALEIKWPQIGNEKAIAFLRQVVSKRDPFGAYIFLGPDDLGKSTIALAFARNLMAVSLEEASNFNTDLHIIKPEKDKKVISIAQIRDLIKILSLSSFLNSYKIGIIKEAQKLTQEAQNALLKTLEEPKDKVIVILLANNEDNLLPTILSRGQKLYFQPVPAETIYNYLIEEHGAKRSLAKDLANLSLGRPLKAVKFLEDPVAYDEYNKKAAILLQFLIFNVNKRLEELSRIFSDKTYSPAAVSGAEEIIMILEGLWRDLLLLYFNQPEKIQHSALKADLEKALVRLNQTGSDSFSNKVPIFLLERFKLAAMAREYLSASVNPYLVLEQLAINL